MESHYSQDPQPQVSNPQREDDYNCRSYPQGARGPSPTLGSPAQESYTNTSHLEHSALKVNGTYFQESQNIMGNRDGLLRKHTHNLTHSRSHSRISHLKETGLHPPAALGEPTREAEGNWSSPWGHRHWWQAILKVLSTTWSLAQPSSTLEHSL